MPYGLLGGFEMPIGPHFDHVEILMPADAGGQVIGEVFSYVHQTANGAFVHVEHTIFLDGPSADLHLLPSFRFRVLGLFQVGSLSKRDAWRRYLDSSGGYSHATRTVADPRGAAPTGVGSLFELWDQPNRAGTLHALVLKINGSPDYWRVRGQLLPVDTALYPVRAPGNWQVQGINAHYGAHGVSGWAVWVDSVQAQALPVPAGVTWPPRDPA